jgi:hypothetical protein
VTGQNVAGPDPLTGTDVAGPDPLTGTDMALPGGVRNRRGALLVAGRQLRAGGHRLN